METYNIVYLPLPTPPRKTTLHDETRLAVHKKVRDVIRKIAEKRNRKISEVVWEAVADHWVLRMNNSLEELHMLLSPDPALIKDTGSYVSRGIAEAQKWDKKPISERGIQILADTGYCDEYHQRVVKAAAVYNLRVHQLLRMSDNDLQIEKKKVEKDLKENGLNKDDFDILPTIVCSWAGRENEVCESLQ